MVLAWCVHAALMVYSLCMHCSCTVPIVYGVGHYVTISTYAWHRRMTSILIKVFFIHIRLAEVTEQSV